VVQLMLMLMPLLILMNGFRGCFLSLKWYLRRF
jgi:hypothetical protein